MQHVGKALAQQCLVPHMCEMPHTKQSHARCAMPKHDAGDASSMPRSLRHTGDQGGAEVELSLPSVIPAKHQQQDEQERQQHWHRTLAWEVMAWVWTIAAMQQALAPNLECCAPRLVALPTP